MNKKLKLIMLSIGVLIAIFMGTNADSKPRAGKVVHKGHSYYRGADRIISLPGGYSVNFTSGSGELQRDGHHLLKLPAANWELVNTEKDLIAFLDDNNDIYVGLKWEKGTEMGIDIWYLSCASNKWKLTLSIGGPNQGEKPGEWRGCNFTNVIKEKCGQFAFLITDLPINIKTRKIDDRHILVLNKDLGDKWLEGLLTFGLFTLMGVGENLAGDRKTVGMIGKYLADGRVHIDMLRTKFTKEWQ